MINAVAPILANVKKYGARGDGSTDDTAAIQAAIDAGVRSIFFPSGIYKVTDTLQINAHGIRFLGEGKQLYGYGVGSEIRLGATNKPLIQLGTDDGNGWDANEYDGYQNFVAEDIALFYNASGSDSALSNGQGNYGAGTYGIRDWRGGDIRLRNVLLRNFEYGFWGVQSDINLFDAIDPKYCKTGIYIGPRSDQNTLRHLNCLYNDRDLWIDGAFHTRVVDSQFVGSGTDTICPIKVGSSDWARGCYDTVFDRCWFEHVQGTEYITAFIEFGQDDSVKATDLEIRNPLVLTGVQASANYAKYFLRVGFGDKIKLDLGFANPAVSSLDRFIEYTGSLSNPGPNVLLLCDTLARTHAVVNTGTGSLVPLTLCYTGGNSDGFQIFRQGNAHVALRTSAVADTQMRFVQTVSGAMSWGDGTNPQDTGFSRIAANILGTASGDKLVANGGLGVGNSAAGSSLGTVTKKVEIFDAAGTSLGFVPVYDAIT